MNPSAATIDALARALLLSGAERAHLHSLARTGRRADFVRETVPEALGRILDVLAVPAYVTGQRWDILAWNGKATALFMDFGKMPETRRNILVYMLTELGARELFGESWAAEARRMVAQFRSYYGPWAGDAGFEALVALLSVESAEFRTWWAAHEVRGQATGRKLLHHPRLVDFATEYATLQANDDRRLKLVLYRVTTAQRA